MVLVSFATEKLAARVSALQERYVADRAAVEAILSDERAALEQVAPVPAEWRGRMDVMAAALARAFDDAADADEITVDHMSGGQSWAMGGARQRVQGTDVRVAAARTGGDGDGSSSSLAYHPPHMLKADQQLSTPSSRLLACAAPILATSMAAIDACAPHKRLILEDVLCTQAVGNTFTYPPAHLQVIAAALTSSIPDSPPFPVPEHRLV